jgi:hypothetical protein
MGHEGASTAFLKVIQRSDLTGHFEARRHEETISGKSGFSDFLLRKITPP